MLRVTRSRESEGGRGEREMEENEAERKKARQQMMSGILSYSTGGQCVVKP